MKNTRILALLLALICAFSLISCFDTPDTVELWKNADYQIDTTLGTGEKTVTVSVTAGEKTIVFTVNTNADTLGAALLENGIVEGENGAYGSTGQTFCTRSAPSTGRRRTPSVIPR